MSGGQRESVTPHSWRIAVPALRGVLSASAVVALYYLLPLDHGAALVAELAVGLLVLWLWPPFR